MESAGVTAPAAQAEVDPHHDKGLKKDAIGFLDGLAIGLDSTAPAYSLAAVIGSIVVAVGLQAPGVLLLSFVPMFLIAGSFFYMNRADPDCGTTFSWVTRALGPYAGWIGGWAVFTTGVLVIGSLADISATYIYDLLGFDELRHTRVAVVLLAVAIVAVMTAICVIGTELSARVQRVMVLMQVGALLLFVVVAAVQLIGGTAPADSISPELSWLSPFGAGYSGILTGVLLGVFIYWGWESAVNLCEETTDSDRTPGLAGLASTIILLVTYVAVAVALVAIAGLSALERFDDRPGVLGAVAEDVLGPLAFLVVLAVITSGIASTQTTILPASRTSLSMAAAGAFPKRFGSIHSRFLTPAFSTIVIGGVASVWYVGASLLSKNFLFDSLSALSIMIAFYYALTGIACAIYWRRELLRSVKNLLLIGVGPLLGAAMLIYLLIASTGDLLSPKKSYTGTSIFGIGVPLAIAIGFIVLGLVLMIVQRVAAGRDGFFGRRAFEQVPRAVAEGRVQTVETAGAPAGRSS